MTGSSAGGFVRARHAGIGRAFGSTTMAVYVIVVLTVFLVPLLVNMLVVVLTHPLISSALSAPQAMNRAASTAGLFALFALALGEVRGPIAPGRFEAMVRLQSPQPRWRSLGPTALRAFVSTTLALGASAVVIGIAGIIALSWSPSSAVWLSVGGLVLGMACADARLLGQTEATYLTAGSASVLAATSFLSTVYDVFGVVMIVELGVLALSAPWLIPFCLGRLRTETVLKHSALAEASSALTKTGDWSAAGREYRPAPSTGRSTRVLPRRFAAAIPRTPWGLWLSAWRTRGRACLGVFLIAAGALLFGYGISLVDRLDADQVDLTIIAVVLATALALIHSGFGAFGQGLEFAAETAGSVGILRLSAGSLLARTGAAFTMLALAIALPLLAVLGYLVNGGLDPLSPSLGGATVLGLVQIAMARIHSATKGPLPPQMTTPIPTPAGDISVLMILAWQFEAVAYGPVATAVIVTASLLSPWWIIASAVLILIMVRSAGKRLRN